MAKRRAYVPLNVFLNGRHVGCLERASSGAISFAYEASWLDWEHTMPVSLSLPLREDRYVGDPVIAVFDNLLPDNEPIRRRVAERTGAGGTDAYNLLSTIGRDCVGALQFLPDGAESGAPIAPEGTVLSEQNIENLLANLDVAPLGIRPEGDFRISIAGAQEKTALLRKDDQWLEPFGTTPTTHIIKPQIGELPNGIDLSDSVENEHLCMTFLRNFGLRVANTEILQFGKRKALSVERFDRRLTGDGRLLRLPQEDCCQALSVPPTRKYQSDGGPGIVEIMKLLESSDEPQQDRADFFRANLIFWLIGATDGHAKNFSLALMPGGGFRMTPFYDVLTAQQALDSNALNRKQMRLAMRVGNSNHYRFDKVFGRHFAQTAVKSGMSAKQAKDIIAGVQAQVENAIEATGADTADGGLDELQASVFAATRARSGLLDHVE